MTSRTSLLRASLLAIAAPLAACGGSTSDDAGTAGAGGSSNGGSSNGGSSNGGAGNGGSSNGGAGSGGAGTKTKFPCTNPVAIVVAGKDTGYDTCAGGEQRRREIKECPSLLPRATMCGVGSAQDTCKQDGDCKDKPNGYCNDQSTFGGLGCSCAYGCASDADCGAGNICLCGDPVGKCVPAACTSATDCKEGDCTSFDGSPGCSFTKFACQAAADACGGDKDCAATPGTVCAYPNGAAGTSASAKACVPEACAIGRPLFVSDALRTSALAARSDWA